MCALITALAAASGTLASQETSSVVGMVLDQGNLEPVSGALVALTEFTHHRTRTDAEGWFRLLNVPAGEVVMRAHAREDPSHIAVREPVLP